MQVQTGNAAESPRRDVPAHAVIGEVGERIAERGELPVEHGEDLRLGRMENRVVEPEVAVHHRGPGLRRNVLRQPADEVVHRLDALGHGSLVLLGPACDLALDVVARLAEALEPDAAIVERMQPGDDAVQLVPEGMALRARHSGQRLIPQHATLDEIHDVEGRAKHRLVLAQRVRPRHGKTGGVQRADDAVLAPDRMRRGQQLAGGLAPQHEAPPVGGGDAVGGIGLAALELLEPAHPELQILFEALDIDAMPVLDGLGADELLEHQLTLLFGGTRSRKLTGPSFTRLTLIWAPKRPLATRGIASSAFSTNLRNSRCPSSGEAAREKLGRAPLSVSAARVNCGIASSCPPMSRKDRFILPAASGKMR